MLAALMRAALLAVVNVVAVGTELGSHQPSQLGPFFSRETAGTGDAVAVSPAEVAAAVAVVVVVELVVVIA